MKSTTVASLFALASVLSPSAFAGVCWVAVNLPAQKADIHFSTSRLHFDSHGSRGWDLSSADHDCSHLRINLPKGSRANAIANHSANRPTCEIIGASTTSTGVELVLVKPIRGASAGEVACNLNLLLDLPGERALELRLHEQTMKTPPKGDWN